MTSPVALVLDRKFGDRVLALAKQMPVWIVSSDANDTAVARARSLLDGAANITTLMPAWNEAAGNTCVRALYEIDEHHGPRSSETPYDQVLVFGCDPKPLTPEVMRELGFERMRMSDFGFSVEKPNRVRD